MIRNGKGGNKTITGLNFEKKTSMKKQFLKLDNYKIIDDSLFLNDKEIAIFYKGNKLYKNLLEKNGVNYLEYISKKLLPDDAFLLLKDNILYIIEAKYQRVKGSVDEKLQTCDFKNKQYTKLFNPLGIKIKYCYVLNDWFKDPKYKDVLEYVRSVNCYYFFNEIPLSFFNL